MRRATDIDKKISQKIGISTHALHAESDWLYQALFTSLSISTHALHAESDVHIVQMVQLPQAFLPTLSMRRATLTMVILYPNYLDFYPRSPCGERPAQASGQLALWQFLPTLSMRRATLVLDLSKRTRAFLPTLSMRRATVRCLEEPRKMTISTHALHAESDQSEAIISSLEDHFYPRSPCGERL